MVRAPASRGLAHAEEDPMRDTDHLSFEGMLAAGSGLVRDAAH